jgi:hypothetical protein
LSSTRFQEAMIGHRPAPAAQKSAPAEELRRGKRNWVLAGGQRRKGSSSNKQGPTNQPPIAYRSVAFRPCLSFMAAAQGQDIDCPCAFASPEKEASKFFPAEDGRQEPPHIHQALTERKQTNKHLIFTKSGPAICMCSHLLALRFTFNQKKNSLIN